MTVPQQRARGPRAARPRAHGQVLADRGAAADAHEQPRSGGGRERPGELVVYGGIGRAARDWESFDRSSRCCARLEHDETLLVQSGKPVGVFRTHADAPRVLIANSNLVPRWATWEHFNELDRKGLMMYGQMTAGSWIYIGSQGIVQGTYETFAEAGRQHFGGELAGRWILTAGLGGMGGAQPLAGVMAGASVLAVECQPSRIEKRLETRYLDRQADDLDDALGDDRGRPARRGARSASACSATRRRSSPSSSGAASSRTWSTDQTSAHDPVNGYLPAGWTLAEWESRRGERPARGRRRGEAQHGRRTSQAMLEFQRMGVGRVRLRQQHPADGEGRGRRGRLRLPRLRAGLHPPAVLPRRRAVPLGGALRRPRGHPPDRRKVRELFPHDAHLHRWLDMARERIAFQGLPARICWLGLGDRHRSASPSTRWWRSGEIGPDRHRPRPPRLRQRREPEPRDGGDARRLGRGVRLAAAQRAAEHRGRRDVGVVPPRRRRRHGVLAARRHGGRVRRHRGRGATPRPRAVERPRDRRDAPRRRGLRRSPRTARGRRASTCRASLDGWRP